MPRRRSGEAGPLVPRSRQLPSAESPATEIRSLMFFPAGVKLFRGWGGRRGAGEFTRARDNQEPTAREDPDADRSRPTIRKCIQWEFFHLGPRLRSRADSRSGSPIDADSGRFRTDPGSRGRGLGSQRAVSGGTHAGRSASAPPLLGRSWRPPRAGTCGTPGHCSAPSRVDPLAHTPTRWPKPWHSGQSRLCNATLGPKKPTLRRDDPSRLAGGSPKHSRQHPHTDPDFSLSPPGERGKKIQRRSESIGKKNSQKGVHSGEKAQTLPTFKRQQGFQEGAGRPLPTRT
ncbi:uncharacterized protein [Physeter macrocephalus]|uniref:Uncharacterized protein isoform X2 n=1 Tax=Physeter macrocephalus TaxID=9755 RepID=A0A2Y9TE15_PHYMC|nr:uncharacterized protein LOC112066907 isoform X2 [Physeter catodon]|eukprot:XP_023987080.2 uncharacterized protein LOC112066907 isoform X2 [Physeter catodon]